MFNEEWETIHDKEHFSCPFLVDKDFVHYAAERICSSEWFQILYLFFSPTSWYLRGLLDETVNTQNCVRDGYQKCSWMFKNEYIEAALEFLQRFDEGILF